MGGRPWWCPSWLWGSSSRFECGSSSNPNRRAGRSTPDPSGAAVGKRIVVNVGVTETRLAVQDGNQLTELYVERARRRSIVGSIYKGVVTNVLPGMQAAFVEIGLSKDAFLYGADYTANLGEEDDPGTPGDEEHTADVDLRERDAAT